jgi:hypothetical protein
MRPAHLIVDSTACGGPARQATATVSMMARQAPRRGTIDHRAGIPAPARPKPVAVRSQGVARRTRHHGIVERKRAQVLDLVRGEQSGVGRPTSGGIGGRRPRHDRGQRHQRPDQQRGGNQNLEERKPGLVTGASSSQGHRAPKKCNRRSGRNPAVRVILCSARPISIAIERRAMCGNG